MGVPSQQSIYKLAFFGRDYEGGERECHMRISQIRFSLRRPDAIGLMTLPFWQSRPSPPVHQKSPHNPAGAVGYEQPGQRLIG